ncbi:hypothetical protein [Pseudodesulfovibrio sp. zrk46]|uniref:hypothetical protein n=1 Tax=Pseudodesulfovibrio sp. zrk46 TaxID=2725288 RepID=UPI00144941E3|nr:hypothetical protein [Pseudodesulfovibrio sp. zrk46]QJB55708.1 hypothetical protein HFN16_04525 [Pseudodesulfovibrio sp. zrk46]
MPATDLSTPFDFNIDNLSQKIQKIRDRKGEARDNTMDDAMNVVEQNLGRQETHQASMALQGLSEELAAQEAAIYSLDPAKVAQLIADPFED